MVALSPRGCPWLTNFASLPTMRVLSWNVAGRVGARLQDQAERVLGAGADVVALQEVTRATYSSWSDRLRVAGYSVLSTIDLLSVPYPPPVARKNFNLLAARHPIAALPGLSWPDSEQARDAFPEKYLAGRTSCDGGLIDVHNAHLPPGSTRGIVKPHAFQAIRRRLDEPTAALQVLCGDFNTPRSEDDTGVVSWGTKRGADQDPEMWDAAERSILDHPRLRDVYRACRTAGQPFAVSHITRSGPKRYDHVYAGPGLEPVSCRYLNDWLEEGLSDHAAVEAELRVV